MKRCSEGQPEEGQPLKKTETACQASVAVLQWPACSGKLKRRTLDDSLEQVSPKRPRATIRCAGISDDKENYTSDDSPVKPCPAPVVASRPSAVPKASHTSSTEQHWRTPPALHKAGGSGWDSSPPQGLAIMTPSTMETCPQTARLRTEDPSFTDWVASTPGGTRSSLLDRFGSLGVEGGSRCSQRSNPVYAMTGINRRGAALPKCPATPPHIPLPVGAIGSSTPTRPCRPATTTQGTAAATTASGAALHPAAAGRQGQTGSSTARQQGGLPTTRVVTSQASLHNYLRRVPAHPPPAGAPLQPTNPAAPLPPAAVDPHAPAPAPPPTGQVTHRYSQLTFSNQLCARYAGTSPGQQHSRQH